MYGNRKQLSRFWQEEFTYIQRGPWDSGDSSLVREMIYCIVFYGWERLVLYVIKWNKKDTKWDVKVRTFYSPPFILFAFLYVLKFRVGKQCFTYVIYYMFRLTYICILLICIGKCYFGSSFLWAILALPTILLRC